MLTSTHPSLLSPILDQYSAGETSYRSYQEMPYAQQCDTQDQLDHDELRPTKISLRVYDRQANDIVTVLIDVIIDISLYSVIRNDEMIHHIEPWDNTFMNHLLSDTARITACESRLPVCYNIRDLQTSLQSATYTYVRAYMCRLIRNHVESTLITFDPEHIDLCTLHIPNNPISTPLPRIVSNQTALVPTPLQTSSGQTHDWCRQLRYQALVNATQNIVRLPSVDTRASMIDNFFFPRYMRRIDFDLRPRRSITRRVIRDSSRASMEGNPFHRPIPHLSQPGPYTRRLIAHRAICDYISSMRLRYVAENSSADSSIDENDVPPLGQRRLSLYEESSDDSSIDEDDIPPLRERHMVDSDSDSDSPLSPAYRQLARRYGWYESSSDSSDNSSVPSLEYDSEDSIEDEIRYLIPVAGGTPLSPKSIWFLEDEISYHETSSVSSSASSYASSSSSDYSSHSVHGNNGLPFEFIDLWHISVFNEQLLDHMLKSC